MNSVLIFSLREWVILPIIRHNRMMVEVSVFILCMLCTSASY